MEDVVQLYGVLKGSVTKKNREQDTDTESKQQDSNSQDSKEHVIKQQVIKEQDSKEQDSKQQDMPLFLLSQCVSSIVGMVSDGEELGVALPLESVLETLG